LLKNTPSYFICKPFFRAYAYTYTYFIKKPLKLKYGDIKGIFIYYNFIHCRGCRRKSKKKGEKVNADTYIDLLERCYKNIIDDNIEAYNSNEFMEGFLNSNEYYFYENGGLWLGA
jgi:hypothetical protein